MKPADAQLLLAVLTAEARRAARARLQAAAVIQQMNLRNRGKRRP